MSSQLDKLDKTYPVYDTDDCLSSDWHEEVIR